MLKNLMIAAAAMFAVASPAAAQTTTAVDANPTVPFTFGAGNNFTPANAVVTTTQSGGVTTGEIALRAKVPGAFANSTGGTGVFQFDLGQNVSFDFSFFGTNATDPTISITNLLTGDNATFLAALVGAFNTSGAIQGSQQLRFGFLNGAATGNLGNINFNNTINNTFRITASGGGQSVTALAQLGTGFVPLAAAVPEPGTWAMMLLGFGVIGFSMRRRRSALVRQMA